MSDTLKASFSKTGQGAFHVEIFPDGSVKAGFGNEKENGIKFADTQSAYDWYHPLATSGNHAAWNICYMLEDYLDMKPAV